MSSIDPAAGDAVRPDAPPAVESPAVESPAVESPARKSPAVESPSAQSPAAVSPDPASLGPASPPGDLPSDPARPDPPSALQAGAGRARWLLLVTVALMVAGLVLLIAGFVQSSMNILYLSIACTAAAGVTLIVFSRLSRRRTVSPADGGQGIEAAPPEAPVEAVQPAATGATGPAEPPAAPSPGDQPAG